MDELNITEAALARLREIVRRSRRSEPVITFADSAIAVEASSYDCRDTFNSAAYFKTQASQSEKEKSKHQPLKWQVEAGVFERSEFRVPDLVHLNDITIGMSQEVRSALRDYSIDIESNRLVFRKGSEVVDSIYRVFELAKLSGT